MPTSTTYDSRVGRLFNGFIAHSARSYTQSVCAPRLDLLQQLLVDIRVNDFPARIPRHLFVSLPGPTLPSSVRKPVRTQLHGTNDASLSCPLALARLHQG
jgi:hypothetical protein